VGGVGCGGARTQKVVSVSAVDPGSNTEYGCTIFLKLLQCFWLEILEGSL
jgi:hypothetical protein